MRIPIKGDLVKVKNNPDLMDKICKVEEYVLGVVFIRPKYARSLVEVSPDDLEYLLPEQLCSKEKHKLIENYVKIEFLKTAKDWNTEIGFINKLEKMFPEIEFWRNFHLDFKVRSFCYFFGGGKEQINKMYKMFIVDLTKTKSQNTLKLVDQKLGEDIKIKPKTNFL